MKIGFACKWIDRADQVDGIKPTDEARQYNTGTTTVAWLNRQTREVAEQKLWDLMVQNIEAFKKLVEKVGSLDENLRMVRLSSDVLPVYTHADWRYYWLLPDVRRYLERHLKDVGDVARLRGVRLSFHPGQFTVLASDNPNIVEKSIEEFEYHATLAKYMGYGQTFQDFKINVHISGRQGGEGIRRAFQRLSDEAKNCITIENEEITYGLDDCLAISDIVPIVLDIHHHWVREGVYILPEERRIQQVIDSWRGVRPVIHYSVSREDTLLNHDISQPPSYTTLTESGLKRSHLRAHSDFYWNTAVNDWALSHLHWADMMCESKAKNLASFKLHEHAVATGVISR
jgi:UV DNA damage repair endonuclease